MRVDLVSRGRDRYLHIALETALDSQVPREGDWIVPQQLPLDLHAYDRSDVPGVLEGPPRYKPVLIVVNAVPEQIVASEIRVYLGVGLGPDTFDVVGREICPRVAIRRRWRREAFGGHRGAIAAWNWASGDLVDALLLLATQQDHRAYKDNSDTCGKRRESWPPRSLP